MCLGAWGVWLGTLWVWLHGACLVESGCCIFPDLFFPFYNITSARSFLHALAFLFITCGFLSILGFIFVRTFFLLLSSRFSRGHVVHCFGMLWAGLFLRRPALLESVVHYSGRVLWDPAAGGDECLHPS